MPEERVKQADIVQAEVRPGGAGGKVTLWDDDNIAHEVDQVDAARLEARGYKKTPSNVRAFVKPVREAADRMVDALEKFVEGIEADGEVDSADESALAEYHQHARTFDQALSQLQRVTAAFPVKQAGKTVTMVAPKGSRQPQGPGTYSEDTEHQVPDYQVALYREEYGWKEKKSR
jgi:hypothetical protein